MELTAGRIGMASRTMPEDDAELLDLMLRGNEGAFTALYRARHPGLFRFALHMTGSTAIADDVTQETFLTLLREGGRYDPARGSVVAFLFGIARKHVLKRLAKEDAAEEVELPSEEGSVLEDLERRETVEQVRRAVLSLPAQYREVIALCDLQELSYEEAAAILGCPVGTVRSRLSRGRELLARKLCVLAECVK
jgi:RNA polymerase sigma-70 factor (ECF subfamily)